MKESKIALRRPSQKVFQSRHKERVRENYFKPILLRNDSVARDKGILNIKRAADEDGIMVD